MPRQGLWISLSSPRTWFEGSNRMRCDCLTTGLFAMACGSQRREAPGPAPERRERAPKHAMQQILPAYPFMPGAKRVYWESQLGVPYARYNAIRPEPGC